MSVILPVTMLPLAGRAAKSGGFVVAVLIGLAIYAATQAAKDQTTAPKPKPQP